MLQRWARLLFKIIFTIKWFVSSSPKTQSRTVTWRRHRNFIKHGIRRGLHFKPTQDSEFHQTQQANLRKNFWVSISTFKFDKRKKSTGNPNSTGQRMGGGSGSQNSRHIIRMDSSEIILESIIFTTCTFQGTACEHFHLKAICHVSDKDGSNSEKWKLPSTCTKNQGGTQFRTISSDVPHSSPVWPCWPDCSSGLG